MKKGEANVNKWRGATAKQFALAGVAVSGFLAMAATGIFKFAKHLMTSDDEVNKLAKDLRVSRDEAFATKSALDAMGKSLEEVKADPKLLAQFKELKSTAEQIRPPDMSEGLSSVREFSAELTKTKQIAMMGLQWIGFYFLKHVQKPMENLRNNLKGLNEGVVKAMPKISEGIGKVLAGAVRLGTRIIQGARDIWRIITKLLDMVPDKVKAIGVALLALNRVMAMGPLGKFILLISAALLLLDDFYTYLEGGDALLTPVWEALTNLFDGFTNSGKGALDWFSEDFLPGLFGIISEMFPKLVDKAMEFVDPLLEFGVQVLDGLVNLISKNLPKLLKTLGGMATYLLNAILEKLPAILDAGTKILTSLIDGLVFMIPELIDVGIDLLENLLDAIMDNLPMIIEAGLTLVMSLINGIVKSLPKIIQAAIKLLDSLIKAIVSNLPELVQMGIKMVLALITGILDALPDIIMAALELLWSIRSTIIENLPQILEAGVEILISLLEGIWSIQQKIGEAAVNIILKLIEGFKQMPEKMKETGRKFVENLWSGILSMGSWLKDKVSGWVGGIVDGFKSVFGGGGGGGDEPDPSGGGGQPEPSGGGRPSPVPVSGGHEDGGMFDQPHIAPFSEGSKLEAAVPLTKPDRAREIIDKSEQYLADSTGRRAPTDMTASFDAFLQKAGELLDTGLSALEKVITRIDTHQSSPVSASVPDEANSTPIFRLLETGLALLERMASGFDNMVAVYSSLQAVPAMAGGGNVYNNQQYTMKSDIKVYDSSGNPQTTGNTVNNNQKNLIRDLKGMGV